MTPVSRLHVKTLKYMGVEILPADKLLPKHDVVLISDGLIGYSIERNFMSVEGDAFK